MKFDAFRRRCFRKHCFCSARALTGAECTIFVERNAEGLEREAQLCLQIVRRSSASPIWNIFLNIQDSLRKFQNVLKCTKTILDYFGHPRRLPKLTQEKLTFLCQLASFRPDVDYAILGIPDGYPNLHRRSAFCCVNLLLFFQI